MKKIFPFFLLLLFLLSGCGKVELTTASIPLAVATDYKDNKFFISAQIANPQSPEKATGTAPQFKVITASGRTFSEAVRNTSLYFSTIPLWSQSQLSILGEEMAKKKGVSTTIDFLVRNRYVRKNNLLLVTHNATPEQVLNVKPYLESYTVLAINRLLRIQETTLGIYTPTEINDLLKSLSNPGIEAIAPMITVQKIGAEEQVLLDGMAVFKDDKVIGSLNEEESRGFHLMRPKTNTGGLFPVHSPLNQEEWITLEISRSKAKTKTIIEGQNVRVKISLEVEGNFYEQSGTGNLFTPEMFSQVEHAAEQELQRQMIMCIRKAQSLNSDILGWGYSVYRKNPELWEKLAVNWDEQFPAIPYELEVKFELRRSYLTDKSFVFR